MSGDNYEMDELPPKHSNARNNHSYTEVPTAEYKEDKYEKPWERVIHNATKKGKHMSEPVKSVPCTVLLLVFGTFLLLGYLTQLIEDEMPSPVKDADIARDVSNKFSEEAALRYLREIVGDEARVSGTRYHLQKTADLKMLVDTVASQASLPVHTDWQFATGDYWIEFIVPHVNRYVNVSNIAVVLEGESGFHGNGSIGTSLLVNCHYDSVPFALGASDNAAFCAIMVEALSRLSRRQTKLKHNVIFLFNGAEENTLQGSHAFLQHEWSRNFVGVINLDASGMNGKANLFQVTDTRILNAFRRSVRRPSAQGFGEYLFSSGIVPSDTDFRVWRDFGDIHGVDIAFVKWGCVYHTRYDHPDLIRAGVVQAAGDMLLDLVTDVANMEQLVEKSEPTSAVYYDYLNLFVIVYSKAAAIAVDLVAVAVGLAGVALYLWMVGFNKSSAGSLGLACVGRVAAELAGALLAFLVTLIMSAIGGHLKYLSQPWVVVAQTWIPYFVGAIAVSQLFDTWRLKKVSINRSLRVYQSQAATRLILSLLLFVLTMIPSVVSTRYMLTLPIIVMTVMAAISMTVYRYWWMQAWQHLLLDSVLSLPTALFIISVSLRMDALMLPIMGRTPTNTPDYTIAGINIGLVMLTSCSVSGIELLFSRRRLWMVLSATLVGCLIALAVPISPYQDDGPSTQRHYWFHTEVRSYDYTNTQTEQYTGILVTKYDAYTMDYILPALEKSGVRVNTKREWSQECERMVHCNLPLYRARFESSLRDSLLLYTGGPRFASRPSLQLTSRRCVGETCTLAFQMTGPPHSLITLTPRHNVTVTGWSFNSALRDSQRFNNRPVYLIVHSEATYSSGISTDDFVLQLVVPLSLQSGPILDVAYHAHKIYHPEDFTDEYKTILNAMPKYFNVATFLSIRTNYEF